MRPRTTIALLALALLALSSFLSLWFAYPRVSDRHTPVSLDNLWRHLEVIATEPRPVESEANHRVREYLLGELAALGLEPVVQSGSIVSMRGRRVTVQNIICLVPGTDPGAGDGIILASHYDSALRAPGAGDNGAAVAGTLEVARLLQERPVRRDVILLITDGEEAGLLGAQVFAREYPDHLGAELVLNFDARGTSGPSVMFETAGLSRQLLDLYARTSPQPVTSSVAEDVYRHMPNNTDFTVYALAGLAGLNFAFVDGYVNYHTPDDYLQHLSRRSLLHQAAQMWALTEALGNSEVRGAYPPEPLVFFDILGAFVVRYHQGTTWLILALMLAAWAGAIARLRPAPGPLLRTVAMHLLQLVAVTAWVHLVVAMQSPIPRAAHAWTWVAFIASALLALAGMLLLPRRRSWGNASLAGLIVLLGVLATAGVLLAPGGSYALLWPALLMALAACLPAGRTRLLGLIAAASVSMLLLVPLAWLVTVAMRLELLSAGAALLVMITWLWRPALEPLQRRRWILAGTCVGLSVVCFVIVFTA